MTCDNCGHELDQRWNYCPNCAEPTPTIEDLNAYGKVWQEKAALTKKERQEGDR